MIAAAALRAGAWPAVAGLTAAAMLVGGCAILFPTAATVLFPIGFALLAAAAAFTLDEPASLVVDVTPTSAVRRTAVRALALLMPLTTGTVLMLVGAARGLALPWGSTALALAGNILLGFAVACAVRARTGEPGAAVAAAVVLILVLPGILPKLSHWVSTFPTSSGTNLSSDTVWSTVLPLCAVAIAASISDRPGARRVSLAGDPPLRADTEPVTQPDPGQPVSHTRHPTQQGMKPSR
jgi:hypothetical protein